MVQQRLDRDLFNNASVKVVAPAAMALIDTIQGCQPHTQVAAITSVFMLLCEHHKIPAHDAFAAVTNLMNHAEGRRPEFAAVRQYMEEEL